jgi:hypothetical protein
MKSVNPHFSIDADVNADINPGAQSEPESDSYPELCASSLPIGELGSSDVEGSPEYEKDYELALSRWHDDGGAIGKERE